MTSFNTAKTKKGYSKPLLLWLLNLHEDGFEFFMTIFITVNLMSFLPPHCQS